MIVRYPRLLPGDGGGDDDDGSATQKHFQNAVQDTGMLTLLPVMLLPEADSMLIYVTASLS